MPQPIIERIVIFLAILLAVIIGGFGAWVSITLKDPHWMNRAGALIVCLELILAFVEFSRQKRLRLAEEEYRGRNEYVAIEAGRAEKKILIVSGSMVLLGELLHGFGDLLIEAF
jgi:hypothetical protein